MVEVIRPACREAGDLAVAELPQQPEESWRCQEMPCVSLAGDSTESRVALSLAAELCLFWGRAVFLCHL